MGFSSDHREHVAVAEPDRRWCSDGLEFRCLNGEIVTATFVIDCCDRECLSLVAKSGKGLTSAMVQDALIVATERRFGNLSGNHARVQFLTDNGAAYTAISTQALVCRLGLLDCKTPVCSPQSNGIAEAFVKILKRDYLPFIDLTSDHIAMKSLGKVQDFFNRHHPHSALDYLLPKDFRELLAYPITLEQTHRVSEEIISAPPLVIKLVKQASGPFLSPRFRMIGP